MIMAGYCVSELTEFYLIFTLHPQHIKHFFICCSGCICTMFVKITCLNNILQFYTSMMPISMFFFQNVRTCLRDLREYLRFKYNIQNNNSPTSTPQTHIRSYKNNTYIFSPFDRLLTTNKKENVITKFAGGKMASDAIWQNTGKWEQGGSLDESSEVQDLVIWQLSYK